MVSPRPDTEDIFPKKYPPIAFDMPPRGEGKEAFHEMPSPLKSQQDNKIFGPFKPDDLLLIGLCLLLLGEGMNDDETLISVLALLLLGL